MNFITILGICFLGLIGPSYSNPDLNKADLMEKAAVLQKAGKYEPAFQIFIQLSELAKKQVVELSSAERILFYNTYHFYYTQLLRKLVESFSHQPSDYSVEDDKIRNQQSSQKLSKLFNDMPVIIENFRINAADNGYNELKSFFLKVAGDKSQFQAGFYPNSKSINPQLVEDSTNSYEGAINTFGRFVDHADLSMIDIYFRLSKAYHFLDFLKEKGSFRACSTAKLGHDLAGASTSIENPDLAPLNQFLETYCKNKPHNI